MAAPAPTSVPADGATLAARAWEGGAARPVLLVHGLSSNARLWDGVGGALAAAGHPVVAVDLRGHGASADVSDAGPDPTRAAAADLAAACAGLGWTAPVVAGQSWGGNVVLQLAADHPGLVHGLALVDGGWLHLGDRWSSLDAAWEVLAPPRFDGTAIGDVRARLRSAHPDWAPWAVEATLGNLRERPDGTVAANLDRERHRAVVGSLLAHRPRDLYARVRCPVRLLAAVPPDGSLPPAVAEAAAALPRGEVVAFPGGDHDLHAQHPQRVADVVGGLA